MGETEEYHHNRLKRIDYRYRLNRRHLEIKKTISMFLKDYSQLRCLDIGTADGLMLSELNKNFKFKEAIGIDISKELIRVNNDRKIELKIGDAEHLGFENNLFDIIISSAVIEHLSYPEKMLSECHRILKKGGVLIVVTPNPFHNKIAEIFGYLYSGVHIHTFNISRLHNLFKESGFEVLYCKEFMLFPFFRIPLEESIEIFFRYMMLGRLMCNQLIAGKK